MWGYPEFVSQATEMELKELVAEVKKKNHLRTKSSMKGQANKKKSSGSKDRACSPNLPKA